MAPPISRLTLCPQGLPSDPAVREACMAVLLRAGADARRLIEGEAWPMERFAAHLGRMTALRGAGAAPLVVLTRTNPVALAVLQTRRVLEEAVPDLARALWLIFHDPAVDPFFEGVLSGLGTLEDVDWETGPIWYAPHGFRFLIMGPYPRQLDLAEGRLAALELAEGPASGALRLERQPAWAADTQPMRAAARRG